MFRQVGLAALLMASQAWAQPATEIETVIGDQISAFRQNDLPRAFTHAAPSIQGVFGDPDRFGVMVRDGYPMVWRPAEVSYLERRQIGSETVQIVMIRDGSGDLHFLAYRMIRLEGAWRINGVQLLEGAVGL